jgi:hypothetical protein
MNDPDDNTLRQQIGRFARKLGWLLECDRNRPAAIERENYLRRLMGLPPAPTYRGDKEAGK